MKMIEVFDLMAEGKIKEGTKLKIVNDYNELYEYVCTIDEGKFCFLGEDGSSLCDEFRLDEGFLLEEVELIPPKPKKYLIKLTIKGINDENTYLNLNRKRNTLFLSNNYEGQYYQRKFTTQEMQDIQLVRELLEDMEGKYELIGVDDNEID